MIKNIPIPSKNDFLDITSDIAKLFFINCSIFFENSVAQFQSTITIRGTLLFLWRGYFSLNLKQFDTGNQILFFIEKTYLLSCFQCKLCNYVCQQRRKTVMIIDY